MNFHFSHFTTSRQNSAKPHQASRCNHVSPPLSERKLPGSADDKRLHEHNTASSEVKILLEAGISAAGLANTAQLAARWGAQLHDTALAIGAIHPQSYMQAIAKYCGLEQQLIPEKIHLREISPPPDFHRLLKEGQPVPLEQPATAMAVNIQAMTANEIAHLGKMLGNQRNRLHLVTRPELSQALARTYREQAVARSTSGLWQQNPRLSAATGLIRSQIIAICCLLGFFFGALTFSPRETLLIYGGTLTLIFMITIALRLGAATHSGVKHLLGSSRRYRRMKDKDLPHYTVLVAMFREARILPDLVKGLCALDYPATKLDIKLVLEEVDHETIAAAQALQLPPYIEIVIVPDGEPRTKPRALNYALQFARGDFLVIYDAEDRPDPLQLRKAAAHFRDAPDEVVCLQGKLIFDNASENWLSKQFTIEYASLFGGILPMLDKAHLPLPLGGTSNHFRIGILRRLGAWDPYNVTEDADLGMRIYRAGLRAEVLESVTYEEAACQPGNWIRQRTRWLKGWMQTYFVHMRQPIRLKNELGLSGFLALQGHFAGIIVAALVHPWSYVLIAYTAISGGIISNPGSLWHSPILLIALANLIIGYVASVALGFFALQTRQLRKLLPQLFFIPLYWIFVSVAAYRALYQLITAPHYWEKTEHGLTKVRRTASVT